MDAALLQERLRSRAFLYDDPEAYLAGVEDAVAVIEAGEEESDTQQARRA